ncbi:MAG: hypothetical protein ACFFKA_15185 [Candidatus Thorarchaeota archaeon]
MKNSAEDITNLHVKVANKEDLIELNFFAQEFIELIESFKLNFLDGRYLTLITYYNNLAVAVLIAEEMVSEVYSLEDILPNTLLKLIYVNPKFRNKHIGTNLLLFFLKDQKRKGIASVIVKLPQKYKSGINFFEYNKFHRLRKMKDSILLEYNLWNDFGIRFSHFLSNKFNHILD